MTGNASTVIKSKDNIPPAPANIQNIIYTQIDKDILESGAQLSPEQKKLAISKLKEHGVFDIKGTISEVAEIMGMSESSVYRYLHMISRNEKK